MGACQQGVGVGQRAETGVDVDVVGHVVAPVVLRRGVEGRDPEGVHAEVAQVGQPPGDAGQVTDAVAVGVGEAADVDLVDDGVAPPGPGTFWIVKSHGGHPVATIRRRGQSGRAVSGNVARVDGDPDVLGGGDHPAVGVVERAGRVDLAALAAAGVADEHVLLADHRQGVDARGHPAEHGRVGAELTGPPARAVEGGPGHRERRPRVVVVVGVAVLAGAGVRDPGRGDEQSAVDLVDRAGKDPQPVALGAVGATREAGRERRAGPPGVRRLGGAGDLDGDAVDLQQRVLARRRLGDRAVLVGRDRDAVALGGRTGVSSGGGRRNVTVMAGHAAAWSVGWPCTSSAIAPAVQPPLPDDGGPQNLAGTSRSVMPGSSPTVAASLSLCQPVGRWVRMRR